MIIDLNFKNLKPKSIVITKKGFKFKYLGKGKFLDLTTNLTWLPQEPGTYTHHQALELETKDKRLPTKEEFVEAEKQGIREIFDMYDKYYWSASVHRDGSGIAFDFFGVNGGVYSGNRNFNYGGSVLCVGRR